MLDTLVRAVMEGGHRALELQRELQSIPPMEKSMYKGDFRTKADIESQEIIKKILHDKYPSIPIVAEEDEPQHLEFSTYFTVDPLDGTWIYSRRCREWGVILGYVKNHVPAAVAAYLPAENIIIKSQREQGCFLNGEQVHLQHHEPLKKSIIGVLTNANVSKDVHNAHYTPLIYEALATRNLSSNIGSTAEVLLGRAEAYVSNMGAIWDHVLALAIQEAGGTAVSFDGSSLEWTRIKPFEVIFAASRELAEEIVLYMKQP